MIRSEDLSDLDLVFRLGNELLSVPVRQVREVAPFQPESAVPVPRAPDFVAGVVNHHGRIVTLVDLGRFIDVDPGPEPATHLIVLAREDVALGIVCQGVDRISARSPEDAGEAAAEGLRRVDLDEAMRNLEAYFE